MKQLIGLLAVILSIVAYVPYFRDMFRRRVRPHPFSWFIWGLSSLLVFALQITHGAGAGAWVTATVAGISFIVCGFALYLDGQRDITRSDVITLGFALLAILLWLAADQPVLSALLLTAADFIGLIPTVRKTWVDPQSESYPMWFINGARHLISIGALGSFNIITLSNPIFWAVSNLSFCLLIWGRRKMLRKQHVD